MTLMVVGDQFVNLDHVVSFDLDGQFIARVWFVGSQTPINIDPPAPVNMVFNTMKPQMIVVGDQIVNLDNVVSFDSDGGNVARIWFVGSPTPVPIQGQIPVQ